MNELEYKIGIFSEDDESFKSYTPKIYSNNQWKPLIPYLNNDNEWQPFALKPDIEDESNPTINPSDCCLTFSSPYTFTFTSYIYSDGGSLEYSVNKSVNKENWFLLEPDTEISITNQINNNYEVYIRGTNNTTFNQGSFTFYGSDVTISGNIAALLDWETLAAGSLPTMGDSAFSYLFNSNDAFIDASGLILPYLELTSQCYDNMFSNCTSLTTAPQLPATILASYCYASMFSGCSSLTTAPQLPITTLFEGCYYSMFRNCYSLTSAPELPAITLATNCYYDMFRGCHLRIPPTLPATTLAVGCYRGMFYDCWLLNTIPELPAIQLKDRCYQEMFRGCNCLKLSTTQTGNYQTQYRIPSSGTGTIATNALKDMFILTTGTFTGTPTINTTYYTSNTVVS